MRMAAPPLLKAPMLRHPRPRHAQNGFTFIELLVTMTIFSIVCAMAVPNFRQLGAPYAVRQAASQVAADFQAIRMRAIARNTSYRFQYTASTHTYQMQRLQAGNWVTERSSMLPKGVEVGTVNTTPIVNSRGMFTANVTIPLTASGHSKTVTVNVLGKTTIS